MLETILFLRTKDL